MKPINDEIKLPIDGELNVTQQIRSQLIEPYCTQMNTQVIDPLYFPDDESLEHGILQIACNYFEPGIEEKFIEMMNKKMIFPTNQPDTYFSFQELYQLDAAWDSGLDLPDPLTMYTVASDVIPSCIDLYNGQGSREQLLASIGFTFHPDTMGIYFRDESVFDDYKAFLNQFILSVQSQISKLDAATLSDVQNLKLDDLLAGFWLRGDMFQGNKEYSFQRIIYSSLLDFAASRDDSECGVLPFSVGQFFSPLSITLINIKSHAESSEMTIRKAWHEHLDALEIPVQPIPGQKMSQLDVLATDLNHSYADAQRNLAAFLQNKASDPMLRLNQTFAKTRPTPQFYMRKIEAQLKRMKDSSRSQNIYKRQAKSYARANRRNPDDLNKKGTKLKKFYYPDILLLADCSGSISEEDYMTSCEIAVCIAKKFNTDVYFASFSTRVSGVTKVPVKGRSTKQILDYIHNINKVSGGTDYEPVWDLINGSKKLRNCLSIMISDFEVGVPSYGVKHPKNLLYIPCALADWDRIRCSAEDFAKAMYRYDPAIRRKICM